MFNNRMLRSFYVLILLCMIVFSTRLFATNSDYHDEVSTIIDAFQKQDKQAIAALVVYPLNRIYPIPDVKDETELLARFDEIFDANFISLVANSNIENDWHEVGWRGVMFSHGKMWMEPTGKIWALNYQSLQEQKRKVNLVSKQKQALHPSIQEYDKQILEWKTARFRIRIDDIGDENYRYTAWSINKKVSDKPDLVLLNGRVKYLGSGGNHHYSFTNHQYTYRCDVIRMGKDSSPQGILQVFKNNKLILSEDVLDNISR